MTSQINTNNVLSTPIFNVPQNHHELLMPFGLQGNQRKVTIAIRVYGVKGTFTGVGRKTLNGTTYNQVIGQFQGCEFTEEVEENGKKGLRYAPLQGYFASPLHLPQETHQYLGETIPVPPETRVTFLVSDEDMEAVQEASQVSTGVVQSGRGEFGKTQNTWVIRTEVNFYQALAIISPSNRNPLTGVAEGFRHTPSFLIQEPIHLVPGENIMAYTNLEPLNFPFTRLTIDELAHPLVAHLVELITVDREEGYYQSVFNGTRRLGGERRNVNLPSVAEAAQGNGSVKALPTPVERERVDRVAPPSNFMGGEGSGRPTTSLPRTASALSGKVILS